MTWTYRHRGKARVRKSTFYGTPCWVAARPGQIYLAYGGFHFYNWEDAIAYATAVAP